MKSIKLFLVLFTLTITGQHAQALSWLWGGQAPWLYSIDTNEWLYVSSIQDSVWFIGGSTIVEFATPEGFSPVSVAGMTITVTGDGNTSTITFNADGTYVNVVDDTETYIGNYQYCKSGPNTAIGYLLENSDNQDIAALSITFTSVTQGTITGRTTNLFETSPIFVNFVVQ